MTCHDVQERDISERIRHPEYNDWTFRNDLALLRLATPVNTSVYVPSCLPASGTDHTGSDVWVLGWGRTQEGGEVSDTLQELQMTVVEDEECHRAMSGDTFPGEQLGAGGERRRDGCQGDSGGGLITDGEAGVSVLVGVTSFGHDGCGEPRVPAIYTRVASFSAWLQRELS